jgi:hypothetical protein
MFIEDRLPQSRIVLDDGNNDTLDTLPVYHGWRFYFMGAHRKPHSRLGLVNNHDIGRVQFQLLQESIDVSVYSPDGDLSAP